MPAIVPDGADPPPLLFSSDPAEVLGNDDIDVVAMVVVEEVMVAAEGAVLSRDAIAPELLDFCSVFVCPFESVMLCCFDMDADGAVDAATTVVEESAAVVEAVSCRWFSYCA